MWLSPGKYGILLAASILVLVGTFILHLFRLIPTRDTWIVLALVLLLDFLPPYFLVPIHLHRNHRVDAQPEFMQVNPTRDIIPEEAWLRIREGVAHLEPCGFQVVGHFQESGNSSPAMGYVTLLKNTNLITVARLVTVFGKILKGRPGQSSLVFITELTDERSLITNNSANIITTPRRRDRIRLWLPEVQDLQELYDFHQRLVERFGKQAKPYDVNGDFTEHLKRDSQDQRARWVKSGYYCLDSAAGVYRLTWKGAVLIAWKRLWPLKSLRRAWRKHQTNKLLRKLEE
jgi:hypothetical protein